MRKFFVIVLFCLVGAKSESLATVYDGGVYDPSKVKEHTDFGSDQRESTVTDFGAEKDRYSNAPIGKPFYVLDEDQKCYWGNFSYNRFEKALIVYKQTPLPKDLCIYQEIRLFYTGQISG